MSKATRVRKEYLRRKNYNIWNLNWSQKLNWKFDFNWNFPPFEKDSKYALEKELDRLKKDVKKMKDLELINTKRRIIKIEDILKNHKDYYPEEYV